MVKDLKGQKFGHLTVVEFAGLYRGKQSMWKVRCDCGNEKIVRGNNLTSGAVKSCGCIRGEAHSTHKGSKTRLYRIWYGIIRRTEDSGRKEYADYGGRGIKMCPEWRNDFAVFRDWAKSAGYTNDLSIDRIDNDGDYTPNNCRWVSKTAQENNKRGSRLITANGKTMTSTEWSREVGIPAYQIRRRIYKGWSDDAAVNTPLIQSKQHK